MKHTIYLSILCLTFIACESSSYKEADSSTIHTHGNPHAEGFDLENSDAKAIAIADEVMEAMGGYKNWVDTRYIKWNFFNNRRLLWDKQTGDVKVESIKSDAVMVVNIHTDEGMAKKNGQLVTHPDSLKPMLKGAKNAWINDSYWLVMPFKLKDSGVTLKYIGEDTTNVGKLSDVLSLTFKEVGVTPQNKYHVFVDKESRLVTQWQFFLQASDENPRFSIPWHDYKKQGNILLSADRGGNKLTEVEVLETLEADAFVLK